MYIIYMRERCCSSLVCRFKKAIKNVKGKVDILLPDMALLFWLHIIYLTGDTPTAYLVEQMNLTITPQPVV